MAKRQPEKKPNDSAPVEKKPVVKIVDESSSKNSDYASHPKFSKFIKKGAQ